jgi:hypothetical protein
MGQPGDVRPRFARGVGIALAAIGWLAALDASAAGIDVRCARLSRAQVEELEARARLALAAHPKPDLVPLAVVCDPRRAWLETPARPTTVPIDEREGLVEGALAALESLSLAPPPAPPPPGPTEPSGSTSAPPTTERAAALAPPTPAPTEPSAPRSPVPREFAGGIGLAACSEPWPDGSGVSLGPRLDVALHVGGPLAALASESVRFAVAPGGGPSTSLVDVQAGVAWGAPFASRRAVGFVLLVGLERFAASSSDDALRSADVWTAAASLGARASVRAGPLELWLGLDAIARATQAETPEPVRARLPRFGGALSVGFFYPAERSLRLPASP